MYGSDIQKIRSRSRDLVSALQKKRPDASFFRVHLENWSPDLFAELTQSVGLFSSKYIVLLDNILTGQNEQKENADAGSPSEILMEYLPKLKTSDHVWIIVEDALFGQSSGKELGVKLGKELADIKKLLEKHSDKLDVHEIKNEASASSSKYSRSGASAGQPNTFAFTDAFFEKNAIQAVNVLTQLQAQGVAPEEIHGALWWQTKVMYQIARKDTKGLSPYAVQKSTRMLSKWNKVGLYDLSMRMIESYHMAHLGKTDLNDELVKMTLRFSR